MGQPSLGAGPSPQAYSSAKPRTRAVEHGLGPDHAPRASRARRRGPPPTQTPRKLPSTPTSAPSRRLRARSAPSSSLTATIRPCRSRTATPLGEGGEDGRLHEPRWRAARPRPPCGPGRSAKTSPTSRSRWTSSLRPVALAGDGARSDRPPSTRPPATSGMARLRPDAAPAKRLGVAHGLGRQLLQPREPHRACHAGSGARARESHGSRRPRADRRPRRAPLQA